MIIPDFHQPTVHVPVGPSGFLQFAHGIAILGRSHLNWPELAKDSFACVARISDLAAWTGMACLAAQQSTTLELVSRWLVLAAGVLAAAAAIVVFRPHPPRFACVAKLLSLVR